jgi:signal transduction histidine kinase
MLEPLEVGPRADHWKRFALLVAHDLKEPLRNTANCARMLSSMIKDESAETKKIMQWLLESSERLQDMVDGLLEHARQGHEPLEVLDLNAMVQDVMSDLRMLLIKSGGTVQVGDLSPLKAGPLGMRLVLLNLMENAIKYRRPDAALEIEVSTEQHKDGCRLLVRDNGKGMTPEQMQQAFDPFRRFDKEVDGLGIGLSHVYKIVEAHGGSIEITSEVVKGTTFTLDFPVG